MTEWWLPAFLIVMAFIGGMLFVGILTMTGIEAYQYLARTHGACG